jgi:DNA-binding response OmpR family regulator
LAFFIKDKQMKSLLIVEDEQIVALSLRLELEQLGYDVVGIASTEDEAVSFFQEYNPSLVLMDINLESGGSGIEAAKRINAIRHVPIVYVTAYANDDIVKEANEANPIGYIVKPYNLREIKAVIETSLNRFKHEKEIIESEAKLQVAMQAADLSLWEFNPEQKHFVFSGTEVLQEYFGKLSPISVEEFIQCRSSDKQYHCSRRDRIIFNYDCSTLIGGRFLRSASTVCFRNVSVRRNT